MKVRVDRSKLNTNDAESGSSSRELQIQGHKEWKRQRDKDIKELFKVIQL